MTELTNLFYRLAAGAIVLGCVLVCAPVADAQKNEHYNSPLYSPRKYDPTVTTASGLPEPLKKVGIEQRLGEQVPLDAVFRAEDGRDIPLRDLLGKGRPVILALVYYECPMLCNQVLNGLTGSLKGINLDIGKDFDVLAVSFDAGENEKPGLAANKKAGYVERYGRPGAENGWHFLTGDQNSIDRLTESVGFSYEWDHKSDQFAHASGIIILTPEGKVSRYFYGIDYAPRDVRLGLVDSAESRVGSVTDQLLLYCFHYDPSTGKYGFAVLSALRIAAVVTLIGMGAMGFIFWRRGRISK